MTTTGIPQAQTSATLPTPRKPAPAASSDAIWLREPDPRWRFWWKGAVPSGVLAALSLYTLVIVAYRAQGHVQEQVTKALEQQGLSWVNVRTEGLDISLSGSPPTLSAARAAERFAKEAKCDTWLGAMPCVSRVREAFSQPEASQLNVASAKPFENKASSARTSTNAIAPVDPGSPAPQDSLQPVAVAMAVAPALSEAKPEEPPRFFDLKVVLSPVTVRLEGEVPNEADKVAIQDGLRSALAARGHDSSPQLDNQLQVNAGVAQSSWQSATKLAISMAARCTTGYVALHEAALTVDCETQTAAQRTSLIAAGAEIPPGITVAGLNVLALDEIQQCEEALVKLVSRSQIRFTTNSASLLPTSRPLLREIAHQLERCPGVVVVEGHTDGQGVREENLTLSLNRARAVVASLVGYGVAEARVRAEGFGPDKPLATNENATGRAQNRRIEFRVARSSEFSPSSAPTKTKTTTPKTD